MLSDALRSLFAGLIDTMLRWVRDMSGILVETSLKAESCAWLLDTPLNATLIENVFRFIYGAAVVLVALKFIWKGFQVYVLWRDGDADVSPHNMLLGACLALVVSLAFPTIYNIGVSTVSYLGESIVNVLDENWVDPPMEVTDSVAVWREFYAPFDSNGDYSIDDDEELDHFNEVYPDGKIPYAALQAAFPAIAGRYTAEEWEQVQINAISLSLGNGGGPFAPSNFITYTYLAQELGEGYDVDPEATATETADLPTLILILIYLIAYLLLYLKLIGRGIEMLVLRLGFPIAAIGLVNSDGGIFHSYVQLILKQMATSVIQVALMYLSFRLAMRFTFTNIFLAFAVLLVAFRTPTMLSQLLAPQRQGGGMGQKLHTTMMLWQLWRK